MRLSLFTIFTVLVLVTFSDWWLLLPVLYVAIQEWPAALQPLCAIETELLFLALSLMSEFSAALALSSASSRSAWTLRNLVRFTEAISSWDQRRNYCGMRKCFENIFSLDIMPYLIWPSGGKHYMRYSRYKMNKKHFIVVNNNLTTFFYLQSHRSGSCMSSV